MFKQLLEYANNIYYKYFSTIYIEGAEYRVQEMLERINRDKNGYSY